MPSSARTQISMASTRVVDSSSEWDRAMCSTRASQPERASWVGAFARSKRADSLISALGATPVHGDLENVEQFVREANSPELETVVLRPRFVWGTGDTSVLPGIIDKIQHGQFAWIGGGHQLTDTTHVDNAVEGLLLALDRGQPGQAYFVTDGAPVVFRDFATDLVATQGVEIPNRSMPYGLARGVATTAEFIWRVFRLKGQPPVDYLSVWISGQECTINISKATNELGYTPVITRENGLRALRAAY